MKKLLLIICIFYSLPAVASFEPQWSDFCPPKYAEATYKESIKHNPVVKPLALVGQLCTLNLIPCYFIILKKDKDIKQNNYWVRRRSQFDSEINECKAIKNEDARTNCYMQIRQIELAKNNQRETLKELKKIQTQQDFNSIELQNIKNNQIRTNQYLYGY